MIVSRLARVLSALRLRLGRWVAGVADPRATALFLRGLGLVYAAAFASLAAQVKGLYGARGIEPIAALLGSVAHPASVFFRAPSLFWLNASDAMLVGSAWTGAAAGLLVGAGLIPAAGLSVSWMLFLSFVSIGAPFLPFQWDALLLEAGFLALCMARWRWTIGRKETPALRYGPALVCWLLFRLMFASGLVKILSGDPSWRSGNALTYHFETQPLPTPLGWWVHQWPHPLLRVLTWGMFLVELVFPWLIFGGRRTRRVAGWGFIVLQGVIAATGNYGYFNGLTMLLCVFLLWSAPDDVEGTDLTARSRMFQRAAAGALAGISLIAFLSGLGARSLFGLFRPVMAPVASFDIANTYGLFAVMTTERPEIVLQGSSDGETWKDYEFRYKPGAMDRPPPLVAPHQPRLDWQMWFAALSDVRSEPWFVNLCVRLLQNEPTVTSLLARNPFAEEAPRSVRAVLYRYHFTTRAERRKTGRWWTREELGLYCPPISIKRPEK